MEALPNFDRTGESMKKTISQGERPSSFAATNIHAAKVTVHDTNQTVHLGCAHVGLLPK